MTSYNHAPYLPDAIESVLAQTIPDVELVIADDGSRDGSLDIARQYAEAYPDRIAVVTHPGHANLGVARTGNLARSHLMGRFMLGLPSDDMLCPDALERQVRLLERRPGVGYVYGYALLVDAQGCALPGVRSFGADLTRGGRIVERLVQGNQIPAMTMMLRRECLEQAGSEDEALFYSDWELWVRAAAHWDVAFNPRPVARYRVHAANTGLNVQREINLERALQVTTALRERAEQVGGRLVEPRVLATLELQLAFLRFACGDRTGAADALGAAIDRDRRLAGDSRWLADWLRARLLDRLLPPGGDDFAPWLVASLSPVQEGRSVRRLRRQAAAASREATAIRLSGEGDRPGAKRAAIGAVVRRPGRVRDRQLLTVLLDSLAPGPARYLRRVKRRVLGYR